MKDGIVLAVEKLVQSKLLVPGANKRIATVDLHAGVVSLSFEALSTSASVMDDVQSLNEGFERVWS